MHAVNLLLLEALQGSQAPGQAGPRRWCGRLGGWLGGCLGEVGLRLWQGGCGDMAPSHAGRCSCSIWLQVQGWLLLEVANLQGRLLLCMCGGCRHCRVAGCGGCGSCVWWDEGGWLLQRVPSCLWK